MTDAMVAALIGAIPATVAATAALIVSLRGNRKVDSVALSINGRIAQLLEAVSKEQRAEGHAAGVEEERNR